MKSEAFSKKIMARTHDNMLLAKSIKLDEKPLMYLPFNGLVLLNLQNSKSEEIPTNKNFIALFKDSHTPLQNFPSKSRSSFLVRQEGEKVKKEALN